jgi:hypothetical protein
MSLRRLLLLILALTACQVNPATTTPPAPATVAVENTAAPTATPLLPATPTLAGPAATTTTDPLATATPTFAPGAAPDPNLNVGAVLFEEKFDGNTGWKWSFADEAATFSLGEGRLNAVMARSDAGWRAAGGPDVTVRDAQLRLTARTNLCYENDEYGLVFRSKLESNRRLSGYLFKLTCGGRVRAETLRGGESSVLLDWVSPAFVQKGENTFMVWASKDRFNFYLNDRYLGSVNDRTYSSGGFGVYLYDRTTGGASVSFTALTVKEIVNP